MKSLKNTFFIFVGLVLGLCNQHQTSTMDEASQQSYGSFEEYQKKPMDQMSHQPYAKFEEYQKTMEQQQRPTFQKRFTDFKTRVGNFFKKPEKSPETEPIYTTTHGTADDLSPELAHPIETFAPSSDTHSVMFHNNLLQDHDDLSDWDITTDEDRNLKKSDFDKKFEQQRAEWKNIFKSDSALLEKYLTDPSSRSERLEEFAVKKALAKLSRTQIADLFTKITQNEIERIRMARPDLRQDIHQLYIDTFNKNEKIFKQALKDADPYNKKQFVLIPSMPKEIQANSLVNFKFEILEMSSYDPNLTIEENAERMKKSQNLKIQAHDRFAQARGESARTDLTTYIKNYLEDNPNDKNLKALMVNDFTALNRTTNVQNAKAALAKILNPNGDPSPTKMENSFKNLSANQLTDITKAQIKAQEKNSGVKVSYDEAKRIFKQNAEVYQQFSKSSNLIIPAEDGSRNNQSSFKFEIIDLNPIFNDLANLDYKRVDLVILNKELTIHDVKYGTVNINATRAMEKIIQKIKTKQPEIQLSDKELAKELINYLRTHKIEAPKPEISPTEALTKIAEEKYGAETINKIIMEIRDASANPYGEETTSEVNKKLQELIYAPRQ